MLELRSRTSIRRVGLGVLTAFAVLVATPALAAPTITLDRTIRTTPFDGSSVTMRDHEGSAYVPQDGSLWLADDNGDAIYEVNPVTGALKRRLSQSDFSSAPMVGGGPQAGVNRSEDFESLAYDADSDTLYLFSGPCCTSSMEPTAFRLTRGPGGSLQVTDWQDLPATADYTGAAWNPADDTVYVGKAQQFRSFDYATGSQGSTFSVGGVSGITGMDFSANGADLFVTTSTERLIRISWASRTIVNGWNFDLTPFDVLDSRAVSLIAGQYYVSDGSDARPAGPLKYAVFVFDVTDGGAPVNASFTANPTSGPAPLTVNFTDTSTGNPAPNSWNWSFGDGGSSTARHPSHTYTSNGTFTVTLTVSNGVTTDTATGTIEVGDEPPPSGNLVGNPGFETDTFGWSTAGSGAGVALTRVQPGHSGTWAARLTNGATGNRKIVLNDTPNWVTTTQAGTYTASIWVKSNASVPVKIQLREMNGSTVVRSRVTTTTVGAAWTQISVSHTIQSPGTTLDLQVFIPRASAPPGRFLDADDASITRA
jgi:PKD repeat protein